MLVELHKKAQEVFADNASTVLTAGGIIGTVTTAALSVRAGWKSQEIITDAQDLRDADPDAEDLTKTDKAKLVWPFFVPPAITGAATVAAIVYTNKVNGKNAAAWAAAYAASQKQRDEYKAKLEEKLGIKKSEQNRADMARERTDNNDAQTQMIIVSGGSSLCYDNFSDRYIRTTAEKIRQAEKLCQETVRNIGSCDLGVFYKALGFDKADFDDMIGWNIGEPPSITVDTILHNDEPCLCIDFVRLPFPGHDRDYD